MSTDINKELTEHEKELIKGVFSEFPDYYTIDEEGLGALCFFLRKEFGGKTVFITVKEEATNE